MGWGSAVSSPIGVWGSFATFTMLKSQTSHNHYNKSGGGGGGGGGGGQSHFRSDTKSGGSPLQVGCLSLAHRKYVIVYNKRLQF